MTHGDLWTATFFALTVPGFTGPFETALTEAAAGHGSGLRSLALELDEDLNGTSLVAPLWALTCEDSGQHLSARAAGDLARSLNARYPLEGALAVTVDAGGCVDWPAAADPVTTVHDSGPVPALVIGNTGDPNTPHRAAVQLTRALGDARLLTWRGWGHTWLLSGSSDLCMQQAVTSYLVSLHAPAPGTTCA